MHWDTLGRKGVRGSRRRSRMRSRPRNALDPKARLFLHPDALDSKA